MNKGQLNKRKDGATVSCVVVDTFNDKIEKPVVPPKKIEPKNTQSNIMVCSAQDYGNEADLTDEGPRTNEGDPILEPTPYIQ